MPSKYWIKLYHEILDDPKMGRLPDRLYRRCIELFLLAGESDDGGKLPELSDMAWRLRLDKNELEADLNELQKVNIVSLTESGWLVVHFAERQDAVDSTERSRRFRARQKKDKYYEPKEQQQPNAEETNINEGSNDTATKRCTDTDKDIDTDKDKSIPKGIDGAKAPAPVPGTGVVGPKKQLMGIFQTETGLKMPRKKADVGFWWSNIAELYEITDHDVETAGDLIHRVVEYMRHKKLTIGGPQSIVNTYRAMAAGQDLEEGRQNGHSKLSKGLSDTIKSIGHG